MEEFGSDIHYTYNKVESHKETQSCHNTTAKLQQKEREAFFLPCY